ncbi:hypothetical protein QQF64_033710 [Cirrhinus molitorella]|uniref:Uncharacterized protein n=1 Tax=Cirrhinus molitorella TaxID=172907 RepID=A0ABR3MUN7_9TELE
MSVSPTPGNSATETLGFRRRGIRFVRLLRTAGMSSNCSALSQTRDTEAPPGNERRRVDVPTSVTGDPKTQIETSSPS